MKVARFLLTAIAATAALLAPTSASAANVGEYSVWSCHNGAGKTVSTDGWAPTNGLGSAGIITNDCGTSGGSLGVNFNGADNSKVSPQSVDTWTYTAPAGIGISGATFTRNWIVTVNGPDTPYASAAVGLDVGGTNVENCQAYYEGTSDCYTNTAPTISVGASSNGTLSFDAGCWGPGPSPGPDPQFYCTNSKQGRSGYWMQSANITLTDGTPPTGSELSGSATSGAPLKGSQDVQFSAADSLSGIWKAQVSLDNTVVATQIAPGPGNYVTCTANGRDAGFEAPLPCIRSVSPSITFNSASVADGVHTLRVSVWDAAGNQTNLATKSVPTSNGITKSPGVSSPGANPIPNGAGGDRATAKFVPSSKATLRPKFGKSFVVSGHLVDASGTPITGATIDVQQTVALSGAAPTTTTVLTDAKGAYRFTATAQSSRAIALGYAAFVGSQPYVAQSKVRLAVKAGVTLALSKRSVARHQRVDFTGKLALSPLPVGGARIVIQAKTDGRWVLAAIVRTKAGGKFSWSHRFRYVGRFQFRAKLLPSDTVAAASGLSALRPLSIH